MDLLEIRGRLDQIDTQIEKLFEERMRLCSEVAEYKIATGKAVYDAEREKQKIESVQAMAESELLRRGKGVYDLSAGISISPLQGASAVRIWASIRWRSLKQPESAWCSRD